MLLALRGVEERDYIEKIPVIRRWREPHEQNYTSLRLLDRGDGGVAKRKTHTTNVMCHSDFLPTHIGYRKHSKGGLPPMSMMSVTHNTNAQLKHATE